MLIKHKISMLTLVAVIKNECGKLSEGKTQE